MLFSYTTRYCKFYPLYMWMPVCRYYQPLWRWKISLANIFAGFSFGLHAISISIQVRQISSAFRFDEWKLLNRLNISSTCWMKSNGFQLIETGQAEELSVWKYHEQVRTVCISYDKASSICSWAECHHYCVTKPPSTNHEYSTQFICFFHHSWI